MSGAFGGKASQPDSATLDVDFTAGAGPLLDLTLGGFTPVRSRQRDAACCAIDETGFVPAGARFVTLALSADNSNGFDGYNERLRANDISLMLPEPSALLAGAAAVAALAARRRAARRRSERR